MKCVPLKLARPIRFRSDKIELRRIASVKNRVVV